MLKPALEFAYPDRYTPHDYSALEPIFAPNVYFNSIKQIENTTIVYPNVYINRYENAKKLEGANTWKTKLLLPVDIVDKDDVKN